MPPSLRRSATFSIFTEVSEAYANLISFWMKKISPRMALKTFGKEAYAQYHCMLSERASGQGFVDFTCILHKLLRSVSVRSELLGYQRS